MYITQLISVVILVKNNKHWWTLSMRWGTKTSSFLIATSQHSQFCNKAKV